MTTATTERLTFITFNGFEKSVKARAETVATLLKAFDDVAYVSNTGVGKAIAEEIVITLANMHVIFARMTESPAIPDATFENMKINFSMLDKGGAEIIRRATAFAVGCVSDPYLYASEPANYQQAAVVNLHKARDVLSHVIENMTKVR